MRVDLHLHSTASDGSLSPSALAWAARAGGLHVIALTDHDTTGGVADASQAGAGNVHVIQGIELSCTHECTEVHMLGYFVDPGHPALVEYERAASLRRRERMHAMIDRLAALGPRVSMDDVQVAAGPGALAIARPHLARVLVQKGHAATVSEAFDRWIGNTAPAYVSVDLIDPERAIERIHAAGGVAVWAHPDMTQLRDAIGTFASWGLDGIECYRPRCSSAESLEMEAMAQGRGLLVTGGSDWHGIWNGRLGSFSLGREEVGAFLEYGGI
ncbi:MAG: PHP domain-containing protein [Longimicrobiales bacterium]